MKYNQNTVIKQNSLYVCVNQNTDSFGIERIFTQTLIANFIVTNKWWNFEVKKTRKRL